MINSVYFDYAASTPVDPDILALMLPYFTGDFGNPSSIHIYGQKAETALEKARSICGELLNVSADKIVFTSGGTESDNLAIRGCAIQRRKSIGADVIIVSPVEHHAVSHTAMQLQKEFGFKLVFLPVDHYGMVDPAEVGKKISAKTALVSVIYGNNEIGTINPVAEIGLICEEKGIPFHSDAVQAGAHLPMDLVKDHLNLISLGAHKMYGPKGVGLLGINSSSGLLPIQTGGGQEFNLRAGTQNIPLIIGLMEAFKQAQRGMSERTSKLAKLRDHLIKGVLARIPASQLTGHPSIRLPTHASFVFEGIDGNRLLMLLDAKGFACSSGSACKVGSPTPSEVLLAMGINPELALGSLRVTLGKENTLDQVDGLISAISDSVQQIRR